MTNQGAQTEPLSRNPLLGICVGFLAQLGITAVLPQVCLVVLRAWDIDYQDTWIWIVSLDDAMHPMWYALQGALFLGSAFAGYLAALLSPRNSAIAPLALVLLSLLAKSFEQFWSPLPTVAMLVWVLGPCAGLLTGILAVRATKRSDGKHRANAHR
jgi:hypothetical protein